MTAKSASFTYAIVGNSTGAVGCIEAIREQDRSGSIAVISTEPHHVYGRPVISYFLSGEAGPKSLKYRPDDFYVKNGVSTFLGRTVTGLDDAAHTLTLDDGLKLSFSKLLIASGGAPILPPLPGRELDGVFQFNTLSDACALKERVADGMRAVVIGGGLTGLKASEALMARGVHVTLVEMMDRLMGQATDERVSLLVRRLYEERGCELRLKDTVQEILGGLGRVEGVRLASGDSIPCDLVILAIGVRPRLDLVKDTGVKANRGILVDEKMRTSSPDVFACGDAVEAHDFLTGQSRVLPLLPNAYVGGRVAGINMAGGERSYDWGASANSVDFFGFPVASAGKLHPEDGEECLVQDDGARDYRKVILRDGRITGFLFTGMVDRLGILLGLLRSGADVSACREHLLDNPVSTLLLPQISEEDARRFAR